VSSRRGRSSWSPRIVAAAGRSGAEFPAREIAYLYRVEGGKVARVKLFGTRAAALAATVLPEWSAGEAR
jgi:hypothetical protein